MTIPTAREAAAAAGLAQLGKRGRMSREAMEYLATLREGIDYLPIKKPGEPDPAAEAKRAERERARAEKAAAANAAAAADREAKAEAKAAKEAEKASAKKAKAESKAATPHGPRAAVASNLTTARVEGQPTKAYTIVYPTSSGRRAGHTAFVWAPQTCSEGHRIGYCRCEKPVAPMLKGEGSLHGGGALMWSKPASL